MEKEKERGKKKMAAVTKSFFGDPLIQSPPTSDWFVGVKMIILAAFRFFCLLVLSLSLSNPSLCFF
jgi:hypothetical protein